ncbi:hypothetical protein [Polaromonas sp.]|uniref:hypothetical protein n=1 Tax=Polaromonas sp. TaxID=1869339 RepID=UPI002FC90F54
MATAKKSTTSPSAKAAVPAPSAKKTAAKAPPAKPRATPKPQAKAPLAKAEKPAKAKRPKLVRDSFTIPKTEYVVLDELKQRAAKLARPTKKSEVLRAGIKALAALSDAAFLTALDNVPAIKTGRPSLAK